MIFTTSRNQQRTELHKLELKVRALVMLLRNIDVNSGLCNGTTMKAISITTKILKVQITNVSFLIILKVSLEFLVTEGLRAVRATIKLHSKSKIVSLFMIILILPSLAESFRENAFCTPSVMFHYHYYE